MFPLSLSEKYLINHNCPVFGQSIGEVCNHHVIRVHINQAAICFTHPYPLYNNLKINFYLIFNKKYIYRRGAVQNKKQEKVASQSSLFICQNLTVSDRYAAFGQLRLTVELFQLLLLDDKWDIFKNRLKYFLIIISYF